MTGRPRQVNGSAGTTTAVTVDAAPDTVQIAELRTLLWEDWFRRASPAQREQALSLAEQQGLVYHHQLPALNGSHSEAPAQDTGSVGAVVQMLLGHVDSLPALQTEPLTPVDADLDELQRLAVARALATPDVCLIQGLPGTGKSRVIAEILMQAAQRGWRSLLVAATDAPLDVVLERLSGRSSDVVPLRFLEPGQSADDLASEVRAFTLAEQQKSFVARTLAAARQTVADAEAVGRRFADEEKCWPALAELIARSETLTQRLAEYKQQHECVPAQVQAEAEGLPCVGKGMPSGPFAAQFVARVQAHNKDQLALEADLAALVEKHAACSRACDELARHVAELQPLYDALSAGRWWTGAFWRARLRGGIPGEMASLSENSRQARTALDEVQSSLAQIANRAKELDSRYRSDCEGLRYDEIARRQQELLARQREIEQELTELAERARATGDSLADVSTRPAAFGRTSLEQAQQCWRERHASATKESESARLWVAYLERDGTHLSRRLPQLASVLAGTITSLLEDRALHAAVGPGVDLLVVDDAESLTEAELLQLARHARRLVLVARADTSHRDRWLAEQAAKPLLVPSCWPRLWHALGGDTAIIPYSWQRTGERLVCRLQPLRDEDRPHLEKEALADDAEVELRILHRAKARPVLAEVAFPPRYSLADAFSLIVRELGETPVAPAGRTGWWHEDDAGCTWHVGSPTLAVHEEIELHPGLRLGVTSGPETHHVARIRFARSDWERARAEQWLTANVLAHDCQRTIFLQVPYRSQRRLAEVVATILYPDEALWPVLPAVEDQAFEFIAVPLLRKADLPREGAGLEVELTSPRHADRLPAELCQGLPTEGFANYLEAQALVRRLEQLAQTPDALPTDGAGKARVAVLAMYEGQAELLRRLIRQSSRLHNLNLEVGTPSRLRQRECDVVLLSLTRSHPHRSVPFGADVADLALALSRARRRLYVFGDVGALIKRTSWQGPLDHLSAAEAHVERQRLCRLVALLKTHLPRR
jgi:hypothetical protein